MNIPQKDQDVFIEEMAFYYDGYLEGNELGERMLKEDPLNRMAINMITRNTKLINSIKEQLPNVVKYHEALIESGIIIPIEKRFKKEGCDNNE